MATMHNLLVTVALAVVLVMVSSTPYYNQNYYQYRAPNRSHTLILGNRQPGDKLVYQEGIVKQAKWLRVIEVTKTFEAGRYFTISEVRAIDHETNGSGAYAKRLYGGPGYSNVTIKFKSQRGNGINFFVQVFARPRY